MKPKTMSVTNPSPIRAASVRERPMRGMIAIGRSLTLAARLIQSALYNLKSKISHGHSI